MRKRDLRKYAWLSIGAAIVTIGLKGGAWGVTGSVGLLSDALESLVNLAAAVLALVTLSIAARPPDDEHMFGHDKAEYFAGGIEGGMIVVAAVAIAIPAVDRLANPQPIADLDIGLVLSGLASIINFGVGRTLLRIGRRERSMTLEADGRHLMTDVWTSIGVFAGLGMAALTGWEVLDPILGLLVALHIVFSGVLLLYRSAHGLMDRAIPEEDHTALVEILHSHRADGINYHALRTRQSGGRSFISFHLLVPGDWSVQKGHDLAEQIEQEIRDRLPNGASILTHLEPVEDPVSWEDIEI